MAQFADYTKSPPDPNYLGMSKEIDVPKTPSTAAIAIESVSKGAFAALGAVDEMNKDTIDKQLLSDVNQRRQGDIQTGMDILSGTPQQTRTDETGAPDVPDALNQGLRRAAHITQAKKGGRMADELYYGDMQEIAQRLTSRYPGYERYIQERMTHWLGTNPANAQRSAILETARTMFATTDSGVNKWSTFVRANMEHFHDADGKFNEEMFKKAQNAFGNPTAMADVETFVARVQSRKSAVTSINAELTLQHARGVATETSALAAYRAASTEILNDVATKQAFTVGGMSFRGMQDISEQIDMIKGAGGEVDPTVLAMFGNATSRYYNLAEARMRKLANDPNYMKLITDTTKLEAIRKELLGSFGNITAEVGAGNLRLATSTINVFEEFSKGDALRAIKGDEKLRSWNTFRQVAGPAASAVLEQEIKLLGQVGINQLSKKIQTLHMMGISSGMINSQQQIVDEYNTAHGIIGTPTIAQQSDRAKYLNSMNTFVTNIATNKDTPQPMREHVAKYIASDGTTEFLTKLPVTQQMNAWVALSNERTAKALKDSVSPAQWREYRAWNQRTFQSLMATQVSQINKGGALAANFSIVLDDNNQLRFDTSGRQGRLGTQQQGGYPAGVSRDTIRAVEDINLGLQTYSNILKLDGKKLDEYELRALGIKLTKPETGGTSGTGNRSGRTSGAPNGSEGPSTVTFATPFSAENPPNMGPSVAQFVRNPGERFTKVENPNARIQGGFRGMSQAEMDNPGLYVHDDQGIGSRLRNPR